MEAAAPEGVVAPRGLRDDYQNCNSPLQGPCSALDSARSPGCSREGLPPPDAAAGLSVPISVPWAKMQASRDLRGLELTWALCR